MAATCFACRKVCPPNFEKKGELCYRLDAGVDSGSEAAGHDGNAAGGGAER